MNNDPTDASYRFLQTRILADANTRSHRARVSRKFYVEFCNFHQTNNTSIGPAATAIDTFWGFEVFLDHTMPGSQVCFEPK